jgi:hypothetical protein
MVPSKDYPPTCPEIMPPDMSLNRLLKGQLRPQDLRNRETAINALKKIWKKLPMDHVREVIDSVPKHLGRIVAAGGNQIK